MFLNAYLICLRCTRGSKIKRIVQVGILDESVRGIRPEWKDTFVIDDKGAEIYQMQRTEAWFQGECWSQRCRHGSRGRVGHRDAGMVPRGGMSDMISVLHQSVAINVKGGDFLLIGLVFIDVNP
jgi:hypothetical protein